MLPSTKAAQNILDRVQSNLSLVSHGKFILQGLLDEAQRLVNEEGYVWDVALAKACDIYPRTRDCWRGAYSE